MVCYCAGEAVVADVAPWADDIGGYLDLECSHFGGRRGASNTNAGIFPVQSIEEGDKYARTYNPAWYY